MIKPGWTTCKKEQLYGYLSLDAVGGKITNSEVIIFVDSSTYTNCANTVYRLKNLAVETNNKREI